MRNTTWRIFNCVGSFMREGYDGESMNEVARFISDTLNVGRVSIFLHEPFKGVLRLVGTSDPDLKNMVGYLKIRNVERFKKAERGMVTKFDGDTEVEELRGYMYFVTLSTNGDLMGVVFMEKMGETFDERFSDVVEDLSMALKFLARYRNLEDSLKKFSLLGKFTDLFEKTVSEDLLIKGVLEIAQEVLDAEAGFILAKSGGDYVVRESASMDFKTERISRDHPFIVAVESKGAVLLTKKKLQRYSMDEISDHDFKSIIAVHFSHEDGFEGIIALVNKREGEGYKPYKHFDDLDLSVLREIARRFSLASSRLKYYKAIKDEVEKLEDLRKRHEDLINMLREHIKKLNAVYTISQAMRSSYNLVNVYKILLLGITSPRGLNFDRALLLVKDNKRQVLVGKMWAGFESLEDMESYRKRSNQRALRYGDAVQFFREEALSVDLSRGMTSKIEDRIFHYKGHAVFERVVLRKKVVHVTPNLVRKGGYEIRDLVELLGTDDFVVVPLVGRWDTIGVVILDNRLSKREITDVDVEILKLVAESAGLAIENVMNYEELKTKTLSLERQKNLVDYLRRFSESVLQNLDIAVLVVDGSGKVLEWNRKAEQIFGRPRESMMGTQIAWLSPEFEDIWAVAGKVFETRESVFLSNYLFNISGEEKYFDVKFSPLWSSDGRKTEGVIITFEDVTVRYILEMERKRQEKLAALGEMAARVAHELRNPISVIGGFLRRLKKHLDNPELRERYLEILMEEVERLEGIVNEILEFSKDMKKLDFSEFDMVELAREVYLLHEEVLEKKGVGFEILSTKDEIEVYADRSRIKQVLINLVQNAIDAVPEKNGKIRLKIEDEPGRVRVEVWNNGEPIPPSIVEKIFTPFFTTKTHGTGLGLPICKKIVEDEHNGRLWVESSAEKGTSFIFEIPVEKGD